MEPFGALLRRVIDDAVNNRKPRESDLYELDLIAADLDRTRQFVGKMDTPSGVYIDHLRLGAQGINPDGTVLAPFVAEKSYHATDTPIADATFTGVTFNNNKYGNSSAFRLDDDNIRIWITTKAKAMDVTIAHAWEGNGGGVRRADFLYYDIDDTLLGTALLHVTPAAAVEENWFTATRKADLPDNTAYIKCRVKQTSTATLNLVYFAIDLNIT